MLFRSPQTPNPVYIQGDSDGYLRTMSKALIEKYLKRYILNYRPESFKLKVLKGKLKLNNLILNTHSLNEDFDRMNLPLKIEFGLIQQVTVDVLIMKACLKEIVIEDIILVISPDPSKSDRNFDVPPEKRLDLIEELLAKFRDYLKWTNEVTEIQARIDAGEDTKGESLKKQIERKVKNFSMKRCKAVPKSQYTILDNKEKDHFQAFGGVDKIIYTTQEESKEFYIWLLSQVKANLSARITIKGVKIYYQHTVDKSDSGVIHNENTPDMMILCISIDLLSFSQVKYD